MGKHSLISDHAAGKASEIAEAYFFRRCATLPDALEEIAAQWLPPDLTRLKPHLKDLAARLSQALGLYPWDFEAAHAALLKWLDEKHRAAREQQDKPLQRLAEEVGAFLPRLIDVFKDPGKFFVGLFQPDSFNLLRQGLCAFRAITRNGLLAQSGPLLNDGDSFEEAVSDLGALLRAWGPGILLNPEVRLLLEELDAESLRIVLAVANGCSPRKKEGPTPIEVSPEEAQETLVRNTEYAASLDPSERAEDLTIYPDEPPGARERSPSASSAGRKRTLLDLDVSDRTLRRRLKPNSK